jgi:hypothetical protein
MIRKQLIKTRKQIKSNQLNVEEKNMVGKKLNCRTAKIWERKRVCRS